MIDLRTLTYDELEAAGLDDCGLPLDGHPPLPKPKDWKEGRPCAKTALDRGYGWDGREAPEHTEGNQRRWRSASGARRSSPFGGSGSWTPERRAKASQSQREAWARRKAGQS